MKPRTEKKCACRKCVARRWIAANMTPISLMITNEQKAKLDRLAQARNLTPEDCIRQFIDTCQPEGSGWRHPALGAKP